LFSGIVSVNTDLKNWAVKNLNSKNAIMIKNFISISDIASEAKISLKGNEDDFKIICVANLRPQKDHITLLKAFEKIETKNKISLHLIGADPQTEYSKSILKLIDNSPANHKIFFYGAQSEINNFLQQADLAILSSRSEGLPLALLEYGLAGLPVICTNVGQCPEVLGLNGKLFKARDIESCFNAIVDYFNDPIKRIEDGNSFQSVVKSQYSVNSNIVLLKDFYSSI